MQQKFLQSVARAVLISVFSLASISCGGGSGGNGATAVVPPPSPPPPPPPPPTNAAPTPSAKVNTAAPQEGQPFELDASESSDPEGAALTYSWSQTAGPTLTLTDTTSATIALNAPEVTQDETATFQLTVSDGTNTATQSIDVVFTNIAQTPVFPVTFGTQVEAVFQRPVRGIVDTGIGNSTSYVLLSDTPNNPVSVQAIELNSTGDITLSPTNAFPDTFDSSAVFHTNDLMNVLSTTNGFHEIDVIEEGNDQVTVFDVTNPGQAVTEGVYELDAPCAVKRYGFSFNSNFSMLIGQRNGGMSIGEPIYSGAPGNPSSSTLFRTTPLITSGESLCVLETLSATITGEEFSTVLPMPAGPDVIAIDTDADTIILYELKDNFSANRKIEYELREKVSLDLQTTDSLELIAHTPIQEGLNDTLGLVLVYSDKVHEGTHRIMFVGIDGNREIYQETYQWELGVPSDVIFGSVDDSNIPYEVTVLSSSSPQAIVFQGSNTEVLTNPRPGVIVQSSILPIKETYFLETGLGASTLERLAVNRYGLFVTYPEKNQIKYFGDAD